MMILFNAMSVGRGFGKVILFNEHFVVYGVPAIASAIDMETVAIIEPSKRFRLNDERKETPGYKKEKLEQQKDSLERMIKAVGVDISKNPIKITLKGDLIAASGIGASAASCTAIARTLSSYFDLDFSDERINEIAYEGERGYHGTPSGIDNTAATFGGLIWFETAKENKIERLDIEKPVEIVMGNTGIVADTKKAVAGVRKRKKENPSQYEKIFKRAGDLASNARDVLIAHDLEKVGRLMDENHGLLQKIGVSSEKLDFLVELAREKGALGAKLTGGGLGGYMVALTPGKELQEKIANAMENKGFHTLRTRIGI